LFYEASLQKREISHVTIAGIDTGHLEKRMASIDWKAAFSFVDNGNFDINNKANWETEENIESIITDFELLEGDSIGKDIAANLKSKFWTGLPYENFISTSISWKMKEDVSQRFYYLEGRPCIGADEALRFLLNRCVEKELLAQKKNERKDNKDPEVKASPMKKRGSKKQHSKLVDNK